MFWKLRQNSAPEGAERGLILTSSGCLACQLNHFEAAFVDRLELYAKEHGGNVRKDEWIKFLDHNGLRIGHLVVAHQHVALRADVDELTIQLVVERNNVQTVV